MAQVGKVKIFIYQKQKRYMKEKYWVSLVVIAGGIVLAFSKYVFGAIDDTITLLGILVVVFGLISLLRE